MIKTKYVAKFSVIPNLSFILLIIPLLLNFMISSAISLIVTSVFVFIMSVPDER